MTQDGKNVLQPVMQFARALASFIGLDKGVDEIVKEIMKYDKLTVPKLQQALNSALSKIEKKYGEAVDAYTEKLNEFYSMPKTRNMIRAIQQEYQKVKTRKDQAASEYRDAKNIGDYAQSMLNEFSMQDTTTQAIDMDNYQTNLRDAISKVEQAAGSNIGPGRI